MCISMIMIRNYWSYYNYDYDYDVDVEKFLFHIQFFMDDESSICLFGMFSNSNFWTGSLLIIDICFLYGVVS